LDQQTIPNGYKQTELGIVPGGWDVISIDHALAAGFILDQMDGNHGELYPKSHEFTNSGIPYIGATDFSNGVVDFKHCKYLPERRAHQFKKGIARNGDVLFAHNATVGPVTLLDSEFDFVILSTTATYYRCNERYLNNDYLKAFFESEHFVTQYTAVMSQSTRNQVPILAQRKFFLLIPKIEEQSIIANALSDTDALITSLEKLINKKRAIKTATMQQLLTGKKRLPGFGEAKGYKQTELGEIPEDWEAICLKDIVKQGRLPSGIYKDQALYGRGTKIIKLGDVFRLDVFDPSLAQRALLTEDEKRTYEVEVGDVFIALASVKLEGVGKVMLVGELDEPTTFDHNVALIRPTERVSSRFLSYLMKSRSVRILVGQNATQVGTTFLKASTILSFPLSIPDKKEQTAIANVLSDMDFGIEKLEQKLKKIQQIKQGMMQELLTGRTRLV